MRQNQRVRAGSNVVCALNGDSRKTVQIHAYSFVSQSSASTSQMASGRSHEVHLPPCEFSAAKSKNKKRVEICAANENTREYDTNCLMSPWHARPQNFAREITKFWSQNLPVWRRDCRRTSSAGATGCARIARWRQTTAARSRCRALISTMSDEVTQWDKIAWRTKC
jgi:hypothetical protein